MLTRRTMYILILASTLVFVALAMGAAAQTPPPASGDWVISDSTSYSNTNIDIYGHITIRSGGSLTLTNVDIMIDFLTSTLITVEPGATINFQGGSIDYVTDHPMKYPPRFLIDSPSTINGTSISNTYGMTIRSWGVTVSNITFTRPTYSLFGVNPLATSRADLPIVIADNSAPNAASTALYCTIVNFPGQNARLIIVGNDFSSVSNGDGISVIADTERGEFIVEDNTLNTIADDGIVLDLNVSDLKLRFAGNDVENVGGDGVRLLLQFDTIDFPGIDVLRSVNADQMCLRITLPNDLMENQTFTGLDLQDGGLGGLSFNGLLNASIIDSSIDCPDSRDFTIARSTVDVFRTFHQQADASVSYAISSISSIKSVEITCRWLNEMPLVNRILAYYSPDDDVYLGAFVTDDVGHAPMNTITDWYMTTSESWTRSIIKPLLNIGGGESLNSTEPIQLDQDVNKVVYFGDFEVPQVTITIPTADHIQNTTDLEVNGTASDVISGVVLVQFSLDPNPDWSLKSWTGATGTDDWTFTLTDLPEGVHTIYVRAFDYANAPDGIHGNATVGGITVDMTDPVINVSYPTETGVEVTNLPTVLIEGNVSEEIDELSVMGELIPLTGTSFSHTVILVAGENIIVITTTDMVGNVGTWSEHIVIYDPVLPVITITAPASGALLNTTSVIVQGVVDEAVRDDQVVINGIAVTLSDGTFEHLLIDLDEGPLTIDVSAIDLAGNLANAAIDISVDTLPPVLEITYPTNGLLTRDAAVEILGTISEAGAAITVSGIPATVEGTEWSLSYILVEGANTIVVVARDAANNMDSLSITVTLDTIAPFLELEGLDNGTITTVEDVVAVYGSTEPGASVVMVVSGTEITASVNPDGSFIHTFTISELETLITVRAEDLVGNRVYEDVLIYRKQTEVPEKAPILTPEQATGVAAATTSVLIVGVLVSLEFTRYALLLLFIPLYARLKKDAVLDNKTRLALHGLIVENPGMHYNEIIREFNLTNGVAAYHLDVLEREGFLRSIRDGTLRRFYSTTTKVPEDHRLTPDQVRERILLLVTENPGISQKVIVDELGIGRTLVGYHLKTLIDDGYLKATRQGRFTVYSRTNKRWYQAT